MGGSPKGLLEGPGGEPLAARLARKLTSAGADVVLVGDLGAYDHLGLSRLPDAATNQGPLAGLVALGRHAQKAPFLSIACDLPYVTDAMISRLLRSPVRGVVLPHLEGIFQPMFAKWSPETAAVTEAAFLRGERSLLRLVSLLPHDLLELSLDEEACLRDWDSPEDRHHRL